MTVATHITSATVRVVLHSRVVFSTGCFALVWSNFEIADMDFWRGEAYGKFFDFLDHKGGFYYEVWYS
jgi:hypothetical protein